MSRISDSASHNALIRQMLTTQANMRDANLQVTTGKKAQLYSGIAPESERLVDMENTRDLLSRYISNNKVAGVRLDLAANAVESAQSTVQQFKNVLSTFNTKDVYTRDEVETLQTWAHRALVDMESYLNAQADGRYLFAGSRERTAPVDFGLTTLSAFQSKYDGAATKYPTTRDAHLESWNRSTDLNNRSNGYVTPDNWLVIRQDDDGTTTDSGVSTIEATSAMFSHLDAGATITLSDTASNNGTYTVQSVSSDGTKITIRTEMLTDEVVAGTAALTFTDKDSTAITGLDTGAVTFSRSGDTIVATNAAFADYVAGQTITVAGSTENDGTYTIQSISTDKKTVTIEPTKLTDEGASSGSTYFDYTVGTQTVITAASRTIAAQDYAGNAMAGVYSDLQVGDSVVIAGTASNDNTYTIASVASDGSSFTVEATPALGGNETDTNGTTVSVASRNFTFMTGTEIDLTSATTMVVQNQAGGADTLALQGLRAGMYIELSGAPTAGNNKAYLIDAVDTSTGTITVSATTPIVNVETYTPVSPATGYLRVYGADGTVTADSYFKGDQKTLTHRVDETRTIDMDVTAADPAFEKAIRAMGIIAQGEWGTEGGLDQNQERVTEALYLLSDSINHPAEGTAPYGDEDDSDLLYVSFRLGLKQSLLEDAEDVHKATVNRLETWIAESENADPLTAITEMMDLQRSLEASYQSMSRVFELNLADYL